MASVDSVWGSEKLSEYDVPATCEASETPTRTRIQPRTTMRR